VVLVRRKVHFPLFSTSAFSHARNCTVLAAFTFFDIHHIGVHKQDVFVPSQAQAVT
jgi:hypothetical protein